jgi:hypothetical protein
VTDVTTPQQHNKTDPPVPGWSAKDSAQGLSAASVVKYKYKKNQQGKGTSMV